MFWREVQHYKCLFTKTSFSPCDVEVKAKVSRGQGGQELRRQGGRGQGTGGRWGVGGRWRAGGRG